MVTHYHLASHDGITHDGITAVGHRGEDGIGTRILAWLRQAWCGLHGHDHLMHFEKDRMFLQCVSCGHESPGWNIAVAPPPIRILGDARRPAIIRPRLVTARRIA